MSRKRERIFMKSKTTNEDILKQIENACAGLMYVSETDAGFEVVKLDMNGELTDSSFRKFAKVDTDTPVEITGASDVFDRLTRPKEWHGESDRRRIQRYEKLRSVFEKYLMDLKVIRVGKIRIEIYIIGKTNDGMFAGVKTHAVET